MLFLDVSLPSFAFELRIGLAFQGANMQLRTNPSRAVIFLLSDRERAHTPCLVSFFSCSLLLAVDANTRTKTNIHVLVLVDVGNKAAVFPLQLLGFDVDVINSVHFSNHTGYPGGVRGDVLKGEQLRAILEGLVANNLLHPIGHLLTGYIGSESFLIEVLDVLTTLRQQNHQQKQHNPVRFVCDPVLGDNGRLYVPESLVQVFREKVIPMADVVTPNQFEAEQLTGLTVDSMEMAERACQQLHDMGPSLVFITSVVFADRKDTMTIIASKRNGHPINGIKQQQELWKVDFPALPGTFTGTGDLCASLLLAHTALCDDNLPQALERVINTMCSVLERTSASAGSSIQSRELKLIQSKKDIELPLERFRAERIR